jgi:hypothetical protein
VFDLHVRVVDLKKNDVLSKTTLAALLRLKS